MKENPTSDWMLIVGLKSTSHRFLMLHHKANLWPLQAVLVKQPFLKP